ncbi:MAG: class I SAM-dependent methyltransferase [Planctomycetota bacterium]
MLNRKFSQLSTQSRHRKQEVLRELFEIGPETRILDVGGQVDARGQQILDTHPWKRNLTVLNLDPQHLRRIEAEYPEVTTVEGDATKLPFADKSFDLVYSNAVIEHMPSPQAQRDMAREIQRVGKAWFVTTPNRWYPFEFHHRLPFVTWLPRPLMQGLVRVVSYNHVERGYRFNQRQDRILLLTARQLRRLFPGSRLVPVQITFMPETLIAAGPLDALKPAPGPSA